MRDKRFGELTEKELSLFIYDMEGALVDVAHKHSISGGFSSLNSFNVYRAVSDAITAEHQKAGNDIRTRQRNEALENNDAY